MTIKDGKNKGLMETMTKEEEIDWPWVASDKQDGAMCHNQSEHR